MGLNPVLLKLVDQVVNHRTRESDLRYEVKLQVEERARRISKARIDLFEQVYLPRISVLARLTHPDREAVFAHYRAKELRNLADAIRIGDYHAKRSARKRLDRVNELETAFEEVDREGYIVA